MKQKIALPFVALVPLLFLLTFLATAVPQVSAHGGGTPQLLNETAGPFLISVWTLPEPIVDGETHFVVALSEPSENARSGIVVLDANIDITLESLSSGERITTQATHGQSDNKFFYETVIDLPEAGDWQVLLEVEKEGERGTAAFEFTAESTPLQINWTLIGGGALSLLAIGWFIWQSRQEETAEKATTEQTPPLHS